MVAEARSGREAAYGRFVGAPSRAELERFFFLDDFDGRLVAKRRGDRNRVGFALQLGTVRFLGTFLAEPTDVPADVPAEVVAYVAEHVAAKDRRCLDGYLDRRATRFEHAAKIVAAYGYRDFAGAEAEVVRWLGDRAWTMASAAPLRRGQSRAGARRRSAPRESSHNRRAVSASCAAALRLANAGWPRCS